MKKMMFVLAIVGAIFAAIGLFGGSKGTAHWHPGPFPQEEVK